MIDPQSVSAVHGPAASQPSKALSIAICVGTHARRAPVPRGQSWPPAPALPACPADPPVVGAPPVAAPPVPIDPPVSTPPDPDAPPDPGSVPPVPSFGRGSGWSAEPQAESTTIRRGKKRVVITL